MKKTRIFLLSVLMIPAVAGAQVARAEGESVLASALNDAMKDRSASESRLSIGEDAHRDFRVDEVDRNERIVVDPKDEGVEN